MIIVLFLLQMFLGVILLERLLDLKVIFVCSYVFYFVSKMLFPLERLL